MVGVAASLREVKTGVEVVHMVVRVAEAGTTLVVVLAVDGGTEIVYTRT